MTTPLDTYLADETYTDLRQRLARLIEKPLDHGKGDAETQVVAALGEIGGIWPQHILQDRSDVRIEGLWIDSSDAGSDTSSTAT